MPDVTVGCKLPFGLLIQVGGRSAKIEGANGSKIIGGYGLTQVDADLWDEWVKKNEGHDVLKSGAIFMQVTTAKASGEAAEKKDETTGYEPLSTAKTNTTEPLARN